MKRLIGVTFCGLSLACAVMEPPAGGPEDAIPPRVVAITPAPDSSGVDRDTEVQIRFSEKLDGDSFKNRVFTYPVLGFKNVNVKGDRLTIEFKELLPETTVTVLLKPGYQDNHQVRNSVPVTFSFATSGSIDTGFIAGMTLFKRQPDSTGVTAIFAVEADTIIKVKKAKESRIAFADEKGHFRFTALPTDSARFILWAFTDKNGDGLFTEGNEFAMLFPDTIVLTGDRRGVDGILINIIDPNEPGSIEGRILDMTGLTKSATVKLIPILPGERPIVAAADTTGNFIVQPIPPGGYIVTTFIDMQADSVCGDYPSPVDTTVTLKEPCYTLPDTLVIEPGEEKILKPITLERE